MGDMNRPALRRSAAITAVGAVWFVVLTAALWSIDRYRENWDHDGWGRIALVTHVVSSVAAVVGGAFLISRRPRNRCGYIAVAVGLVLGSWLFVVFHVQDGDGWWLLLGPALVWSLRPLLFWLVLAYPIGRLDPASPRLWWLFLAGNTLTFLVWALTGSDDPTYPFDVFRDSTWTLLVFSTWWDGAALIWLTLILVVVQRRRSRFRTARARSMLNAAWYAALAATAADFLLVAHGPLRDLDTHGDGLTPFGTFIVTVDYLRWGLTVAILAIAARSSWPRAGTAPVVDLDAGALDATLRDSVVAALGDPSADVAFADGDAWIDANGSARDAPGRDRAATIVVRDGAPLAALEYDDAITAHPTLLDAAIIAIALQLETRTQAAQALEHERQLGDLARDMLEAEDRARQGLERDLHDGAQQALVGLSLQAALLARTNGSGSDNASAAGELADAVEGARSELLAIAHGRPPALLAERGLDGALGALVMTAGLPVRVIADPCTDLSDELQRVLWFVAAEAVTNAIKHAHAAGLELSLVRRAATVTLTVRDDGQGGVNGAPASLSARVREADGKLAVRSDVHGTVITATFAEVPA
jgi:signal transduction histidine kinase